MPKRYFNLPIIIVLVVTLFLILYLLGNNRMEILPQSSTPATSTNPLTVSPNGSQSTSNISGSDLQQGSQPINSSSNIGPSSGLGVQ